MKPRERMERMLAGQEVDCLPSQIDFTPKLILKLTHFLGIEPEKLDEYVNNHLKYAFSLGNVEEYMHDEAILAMAEQMGYARYDREHEIVYDKFGVGWDRKVEGVFCSVHPLKNIDNYKDYRFPDAQSKDMMRMASETVKNYKDTYYIIGFQHIGLFERAWTLRGYENFLMDLYLDPDLACDILDNILAYKIQEAKLFIECGVDCVRTGDDWGIQNSLAMPPEIWRKFIKPRQAKLWQVYRDAGMPIIQHSCGNIYSIIPDLIEIGLDVLHPLQPLSMDIKQLAVEFGDKLIFFGGIDTQNLLPKGTPDEVKVETAECVKYLGRGRGYIIAPSQEVMSDVPITNIEALIEACQEKRKSVL